MRLERVLFDHPVYDPGTKGAANQKSFFIGTEYIIDYDSQNHYVEIRSGDFHVCVPYNRVMEFRLPDTRKDPGAVLSRTKAVQMPGGVFSIQPMTPPPSLVIDPEPEVEAKPEPAKKPAKSPSPVL